MSANNRRAAPRLLTTVLALAALASACDSATAYGRKPRAAAQSTGYGELIRISPPPLSEAAASPAVAPARFFTINKVLAKPRPFVDSDVYVGPCRRAGIVSAGTGKYRRKSDEQRAA